MNSSAECYGKMFPSLLTPVYNTPISGKVFSYEADHRGMLASNRAVTVNRDAWQQCVECPEFDRCYHLSTATLLMEIAVKTLPQPIY